MMKAIILAAGRGSRLGDLTREKPKCLVELFGRPLLEWQIDALQAAGVSEIALVHGYRGDLLAPYASKLFENARWASTNMVSSLATAAEWLRREPCIISYSDIFYEPAAVELLMKQPRGPISLLYDLNWCELWTRRFSDPLRDAETFRIGPDFLITEIGSRPKDFSEVGGQYMGLIRIDPQGWTWIEQLLSGMDPSKADKLDMTSLFRTLIQADRPIYGIPFSGTWGEADTPTDLALYAGTPGLEKKLRQR